MNYLIIIGLVILVYAVFKFSHVSQAKQKYTIIFALAVILLIYFSFMHVANSAKIEVNSMAGFQKAVGLYFSWLGTTFSNLKSLTGHAVDMNWNINQNTTSVKK